MSTPNATLDPVEESHAPARRPQAHRQYRPSRPGSPGSGREVRQTGSPFAFDSKAGALTHDDIAQSATKSTQQFTPHHSTDERKPRRRRNQRPSQTRPAATTTTIKSFPAPRRSFAARVAYWFGVRLCGYGGSILLTMMSAFLTGQLFSLSRAWMLEAMLAVVAIRYASHLVSKSYSILSVQMRNHHLRKLLIEQAQFSSIFLAVCFLMKWPIPREAAAILLLTDAAAQTALMVVAGPAAKLLSLLLKGPKGSCSRSALIVGTGNKGTWVADTLRNSPELDTRVVGFLDYNRSGLWRYQDVPLMGHPDQLERLIIAEHVDALFIALEHADIARSDKLFRTAEKMGVAVYVLPDVYESRIGRTAAADFDGIPAVVYRTTAHNSAAIMLKGLVDKILALIGLILSSPVWLVAVIAIKLDSPGPIFFKQVRSGLNGRRFELYKFRTMGTDAERKKQQLRDRNEMSGPVFKMKNDPRITSVGKFLRKYSIDELPQLINILKGEMSVVGPRPPIPDEVARYEPWQRRKLSVKPGLTCLWQVGGRNAIGFEDWMKLDLEYIDNWSLLMDARIIARTIPTVLKGSGL